MYALELKNVTKVYGNGILANENVNLSVKKGEIHALMGENGAGKTTLMKLLFGMERPDSGEFFIIIKIIFSPYIFGGKIGHNYVCTRKDSLFASRFINRIQSGG